MSLKQSMELSAEAIAEKQLIKKSSMENHAINYGVLLICLF